MTLFRKNLPASHGNWPAISREMSEFFRAFSKDQEFYPKLEVREDEKAYKVRAELPGLREEDIHVTLQENTIVIEGERKEETKKVEKGYTFSEFSYGSFCRTVPLVTEVDHEKVSAVYKNGVLDITVEKIPSTASKSRKIQIKQE